MQWFRYAEKEKGGLIAQDLLFLLHRGVMPVSVTSDGGTGIRRGVDIIYPQIPHQRCVVHLQRASLRLVTQNPKTQPGKEVRPIAARIPHIETHDDREVWLDAFSRWCDRWEEFLKEKSYDEETGKSWYTHGSLRRVRSMIQSAIPDLFHYLDDPLIPKSTNGLEGRHSSLKLHYRQHRGPGEHRREAYMAWYIRLVVNQERPVKWKIKLCIFPMRLENKIVHFFP